MCPAEPLGHVWHSDDAMMTTIRILALRLYSCSLCMTASIHWALYLRQDAFQPHEVWFRKSGEFRPFKALPTSTSHDSTSPRFTGWESTIPSGGESLKILHVYSREFHGHLSGKSPDFSQTSYVPNEYTCYVRMRNMMCSQRISFWRWFVHLSL